MSSASLKCESEDAPLLRRFGLLQATALNMSNMIGVGRIRSFFSLDVVIEALISTRIVVQFMGQIFALILLRKRAPDMARPYKMWLYPVPSFIALLGWIFIFVTTAWPVIVLGLGTLTLGTIFFFVWSWYTERWPFAPAIQDAGY
ncbi:MAG: hypothetical protein ABJB61_02665 [bacterium]